MDYHPEPRYYNYRFPPKVGAGASLVNTLLDCGGQITIGSYVSTGHDCQILTGTHDYTFRGDKRQTAITWKPVTLGDGVWLASRVTVLPGVTIGDNSVVGAGSVVTKDIPANELWAGVPARFVKKI